MMPGQVSAWWLERYDIRRVIG